MTLTDLSPPPNSAVSLDAAKTFLRVDHFDEDALISNLIETAARQIEDRCGVSLMTRPQRLTKSAARHGIYLTRYPIVSIEAVTRGETALPIEVNLRARPVLVRIPLGGADDEPVTVDFTAGYGETAEDVPTPLRQGVLLLLAHLYEHRDGTPSPKFPMMVDALIQPYRGMRL